MAEKDKDKKPVVGEPSPDADAGLAAEHQRAHDEGTEAEFHARVKGFDHPDEEQERPATPEVPTEGKMIETVPDTTAPSADELRAMGREVKPVVEPTDVPSDRYPDKVELIDGKHVPLEDAGKRDARTLYQAAKAGSLRVSRAEYESMIDNSNDLEDWERADVKNMLRKQDLRIHEKER